MSFKRFCDRCGKEMYRGLSTLLIRDNVGSEPWELCEQCCVELMKWVTKT